MGKKVGGGVWGGEPHFWGHQPKVIKFGVLGTAFLIVPPAEGYQVVGGEGRRSVGWVWLCDCMWVRVVGFCDANEGEWERYCTWVQSGGGDDCMGEQCGAGGVCTGVQRGRRGVHGDAGGGGI